MKDNSASRRATQLGMPFGTASHRLRKLILFHLLKKCGDDICYRCRERIAAVEDLSIEHKEPWEGRDLALFWNIDNIAFSHIKCNRPHYRSGGKVGALRKKVGPEGTAWCARCQAFRPRTLFTSGTRWDGLSSYCNPCFSERHKRSRLLREGIGSVEESRERRQDYG